MRPALLFSLLVACPLLASAKDPNAESEKLQARLLGEPDKNREFHLEQLSSFGRSGSTFRTQSARTQNFQFQQKFQAKGYEGAKPFRAKSWWGNGFKFATKGADTKTFETKTAETKTAAVKDAPEGGKTATVKGLSDGNRPFAGPESTKLHKPLDPQTLPQISNEMHQLKTVEDIKDLLNKNR